MSEIEKNKSNPEASAGAVKKKSGKKLIIIALAVVLLLGAGGGVYYWRTTSVSAAENEGGAKGKGEKKSRAKNNEAEDAEAEDAEKPAKKVDKSSATASLRAALPDDEDVKHIIELQPFVVNLADSDQPRYLRLTINLGIGGEEGGHEKPEPLFINRIRNAMLAVLSVKSSTDVLNAEGKSKLRKELLKAAQAASEEPHVEAIYITDFIVQL